MSFFSRHHRDDRGMATIEFALIGSTIILLMIAVLQIGIAMQSYNALRSVAADTARYAVVEFQRGATSPPTPADLEADLEEKAQTIASAAPYLLDSSAFTAEIADATIQCVEGAHEMTLNLTYTIPSLLPLASWTSVSIDVDRRIFLLPDLPSWGAAEDCSQAAGS